MPCFYYPKLKIDDELVTVIGDEVHHIKNVFRKQVGEVVQITNGKGIYAEGLIDKIGKKDIIIQLQNKSEKIKSNPKISVAFPLLKNKNDHLIVEKLTELGVDEFFPMVYERSVRKPKGNTVEKFKKTAISAIKQCDNAFLPKVNEVSNLQELIANLNQQKIIPLIASEVEQKTFLSDVFSADNQASFCFIIGPEGGFAEAELTFFDKMKIPQFCLGNHILRAETAAISTMSQALNIILQSNRNYY